MKRGLEKKVAEMNRLITQPVTEVRSAPSPLLEPTNPALFIERHQRHACTQEPATEQ
jgi:hypothetical protein